MTSTAGPDLDHTVISGMAVEAPGGIDTLGSYWSALVNSRELISPFPRDRDWRIEELLSLGNIEGWGQVSDAGGFLERIADFDPSFFGISQREALGSDPQ